MRRRGRLHLLRALQTAVGKLSDKLMLLLLLLLLLLVLLCRQSRPVVLLCRHCPSSSFSSADASEQVDVP